MTKCVSEKQRLANRRNAQNSTGPKTPRGKARSARNALKHGLLARDIVVDSPGFTESRAEFDAVLADLCAELRPRGLIEQTLVERIATCYWRLCRAQRFEVGAIRGALQTPDPDARALDKLRAHFASASHDLDTERRLAELLQKPEDRRTPKESRELQHSIHDFAETYELKLDDPSGKPLLDAVREALPRVLQDREAEVDALRSCLQAAEKEHALRHAVKSLTASLPERDDLLKVIRYETMRDRQIHRALTELRRLRQVPSHGTRNKLTLRNEPI